jgi:PadR family transcriptional regulator PadR
MSRPTDLVQGTLDLLILKLLDLQPMHGWAIGQHLTSVSGGELQVTEGSMYQAVHRLEQDGWIAGEWKPSANNRRAKYYSLTRVGRRQLSNELGEWDRLSSAIARVMRLRTLGA